MVPVAVYVLLGVVKALASASVLNQYMVLLPEDAVSMTSPPSQTALPLAEMAGSSAKVTVTVAGWLVQPFTS